MIEGLLNWIMDGGLAWPALIVSGACVLVLLADERCILASYE